MQRLEEVNLTFRIIQFGMDNPTFTFNEMTNALKLDDSEMSFAKNVLFAVNQNSLNPNSVFSLVDLREGVLRVSHPYDSKCMILPNALFSYVDHLEIIEARKAAKESKRLAWIAIWISTGIGLVSLVIGVLQVLANKEIEI